MKRGDITMKLIKKITDFILALVMMMSLLAVNSSAASIKKIHLKEVFRRITNMGKEEKYKSMKKFQLIIIEFFNKV